MRIVLRYYQLSLMYTTSRVTDQQIDTLNNPETSDPPTPAHIVCKKYDGMSLSLKLISSIIPSTYISIELLPPITPTLVERSIRAN